MMNWFLQQSRRDQIALGIGGICVLLYVVWMLGLKPLAAAADDYALRYEAAKRSLANVKALATELRYYQTTQQTQTARGQGNIADLVSRTSRSNNLSWASFNPGSGGRASVRFDSANFEYLMQWLYELEVDNEVQIESLTLTPIGQPGFVAANIVLRKS